MRREVGCRQADLTEVRRNTWINGGLISPVFKVKKGGVIQHGAKLMTALLAILGLSACSLFSPPYHTKKSDAPGAATSNPPESRRSPSFWPPWDFLQSKKTTPPPKAAPLLEVGTIRTVSNDSSYVIVELTPGTLVHTGDTLVVTSKEHPVSRLKVAEVQPPCFAAEVEDGSVNTGDIVKR